MQGFGLVARGCSGLAAALPLPSPGGEAALFPRDKWDQSQQQGGSREQGLSQPQGLQILTTQVKQDSSRCRKQLPRRFVHHVTRLVLRSPPVLREEQFVFTRQTPGSNKAEVLVLIHC